MTKEQIKYKQDGWVKVIGKWYCDGCGRFVLVMLKNEVTMCNNCLKIKYGK